VTAAAASTSVQCGQSRMQQRSEFVVYVHSPASSQSVLLRQTGNRCCGQRAAAGGGPPVHRLPLVSARRRLPAIADAVFRRIAGRAQLQPEGLAAACGALGFHCGRRWPQRLHQQVKFSSHVRRPTAQRSGRRGGGLGIGESRLCAGACRSSLADSARMASKEIQPGSRSRFGPEDCM
uniref:Myosin motor domain-containing protein n=1 Tax=Macrostomum lignano TaxID=282301 RepID=A0A1I8FUM0_9PLAT